MNRLQTDAAQTVTGGAARWLGQLSRWLAVVIVIALLIASFRATRKVDTQAEDFGAYYRAGAAIDAGRSPYELSPRYGTTGAYMYAPVFAEFPFRALSKLPYLWAVRLFMAINWLATAAVVWLALRLAVPPERRFIVGFIALASMGTYLWADIHNGQVGTLLLLACLGWLALTLAKRSFAGGLCLSIAVALKLYPALLIPYMLLKKDVRGLLGTTVGGLLLLALPALAVGPRNVVSVHRQWLQFCVDTQTVNQTVRAGNQSLLATLARVSGVIDNQENANSGAAESLQRIYPPIVIAISAALYLAFWLRRRPMVCDVAVLLIWMTLAAPRCWTFNLCSELLAAVLVADALITQRGVATRALYITALVAVFIAITLDTHRLPYPIGWTPWVAIVKSKHFLGATILAAVTFWRCGGASQEPTGANDETAQGE